MAEVLYRDGETKLIGGKTFDDIRQHFPPGQEFAIARPLLRNVPDGKPGWVAVACGRCGEQCWQRPDVEPDPLPANTFCCCTACALRAGMAR